MPEVIPPDGPSEFKAWMRKIEQRLDKLETARRLPHAALQGGSLDVLTDAGVAVAKLGVQNDGKVALDILAANGDLRARLGEQSDTRVAQTFYDAAGNELIRLGELSDGTSGLAVLDAAGAERVRIGQLPSGGYGLSILGNAIDEIAVSENATANMPSMGDLATVGPQVSVETGTRALVLYSAICDTLTNGATGSMSYAITGATSSGAALSGQRFGQFGVDGQGTGTIARIAYEDNLTPGVNVFTLKYARNTPGASVAFRSRSLVVIPI